MTNLLYFFSSLLVLSNPDHCDSKSEMFILLGFSLSRFGFSLRRFRDRLRFLPFGFIFWTGNRNRKARTVQKYRKELNKSERQFPKKSITPRNYRKRVFSSQKIISEPPNLLRNPKSGVEFSVYFRGKFRIIFRNVEKILGIFLKPNIFEIIFKEKSDQNQWQIKGKLK